MKTLYIECAMGVAGDMFTAALYELLVDKSAFIEKMNSLGLPGVQVVAEKGENSGIVGTHLAVYVHGEMEHSHDHKESGHEHAGDHSHGEHAHEHGHTHAHDHAGDHAHTHEHSCGHEHAHAHEHTGDHEHAHAHDHAGNHEHTHEHSDAHSHNHGGHAHSHASLRNVRETIMALPLPETVRENALAVYDKIAAAESHAHGAPVEEIHFHEVGTLDAIADVVGACYAMHLLAPDEIVASPVRTGHGIVRCAHGLVLVPAPATAFLLQGVPNYSGEIEGEMCTPTGAALIAHFAQRFGSRPLMTGDAVGYGMGTKDFGVLNCVRAFLGQTQADNSDEVVELACNIDDMTAEALSYAMQRIMDAGALDVAAVPATMKKGRAGHILYVLARMGQEQELAKTILFETTTNGVRMQRMQRMKLSYEISTADTPYGQVRIKTATGYDVRRAKPEYDDVARLAKENNLPFSTVWQAAMDAAE